MPKNSDFNYDHLPLLQELESEEELILPSESSLTDEVAGQDDMPAFRTEEILTMIEQRISEEPKRPKRNKVKDVFGKKKQ